MPMLKHLIGFLLFLGCNFLALGFSRWLMMAGLNSDWYEQIPKAPWTPPSWFFGVAWFTIMTLFAYYLQLLIAKKRFRRTNCLLYLSILALCVLWNAVFFVWESAVLGVLVLIVMTGCVVIMMRHNYHVMQRQSSLMTPFLCWALVAISLNVYSLWHLP